MSTYARATLLILLPLFTSTILMAQDLYTVRAGVFRDVQRDDFKEVKDLGYLYSLEAGERETEVYVGAFTDEEKANGVIVALTAQGFRNALVQRLPATAGVPSTMIQFALHDTRLPVQWEKYEALGQLHAQSVDGALKLFTGPYDSPEAARAALPGTKDKGFSDAFVKVIPSLQLIKIDAFETGIKQPLIPINYSRTKDATVAPAATTVPDSAITLKPQESVTTPAGGSPETYGSSASTPPRPAPASAPESATGSSPAPPTLPAVNNVSMPKFNGAVKRHATAELQRALKNRGYYDGSIDGLYGPGTSAAYAEAWANSTEIKKYRTLTKAGFGPTNAGSSAVMQWPEVATLLTIARDLAADSIDGERLRTFITQREQLLAAGEELDAEAAARTKNWEASLWENLDEWTEEDPLHGEIMSAFRIAYYQSQSRLEQRYANKGLGETEARDLAVAMMQNLVGAQLERFL